MATATIPAMFGRRARTPRAGVDGTAPCTAADAGTRRGVDTAAFATAFATAFQGDPPRDAYMSPEEPKTQPQVQAARMAVLAEQKALADLAARCLAGDAQAWEQLARSQHRRIYGICYRFTGSQSDAEDLAQEAFLEDVS